MNCAQWCALLLVVSGVMTASASWATCETRDEDCPVCPQGYDQSPTSLLHLSRFPQLVKSGFEAQQQLKAMSQPSDVIRWEDLLTLHTSVQYLCCYNASQVQTIQNVMAAYEWTSFNLTYYALGCNLDHDNVTVYLHALPDNSSQSALFDFIHAIERRIVAAGVPINHPRTTLFHMTLARVHYSFPIDAAVEKLSSMLFGTIRFCEFELNGVVHRAQDCPSSPASSAASASAAAAASRRGGSPRVP